MLFSFMPGSKVKRKYSVLLVVCIFVLVLVMYWQYNYDTGFDFIDLTNLTYPSANLEDLKYIITTPGCKIPDMDTFNFIVKSMIHEVNFTEVKLRCGTLPMLTFMTMDNEIMLIEDSLSAYKVANRTLFYCCFTEILRDKSGEDEDEYHYASEECHRVTFPHQVTQDYLVIKCFYDSVQIYTDFYASIQSAKCAKITKSFNETGKPRLNVVLVTLDSVSRLNFHRQMPKSARFLRDTMHGIEMLGYNKLGDNTFPVLVTILTGKSEKELKSLGKGPYDSAPFIWKDFARSGYCTAYGEDAYIIQSFNSIRKGFLEQPTDYYLRPLFAAEYHSAPRTSWNSHDYLCFAGRLQVPVLFNWTRDFVHLMRERPHFGYFHTSGLTHDDLNRAQMVDPMLHDLLHDSHHSGAFNNTLVVIMSDHGTRFGPIRKTYYGKLEENLPLLILAFPLWFRKAHPVLVERVRANAERLVSSFDIYETLSDILRADFEALTNKDFGVGPLSRGISLFQEIPDWRNCPDAKIPDNFCACQVAQEEDVHSPKAAKAAEAILTTVNSFTESRRKVCAEFSLGSVQRVDVSKPSEKFAKSKFYLELNDLTVLLTTLPGDAEFEGTVRMVKDTVLHVQQDVSRINRYSNQSWCITDEPKLKKYCYCLDVT